MGAASSSTPSHIRDHVMQKATTLQITPPMSQPPCRGGELGAAGARAARGGSHRRAGLRARNRVWQPGRAVGERPSLCCLPACSLLLLCGQCAAGVFGRLDALTMSRSTAAACVGQCIASVFGSLDALTVSCLPSVSSGLVLLCGQCVASVTHSWMSLRRVGGGAAARAWCFG